MGNNYRGEQTQKKKAKFEFFCICVNSASCISYNQDAFGNSESGSVGKCFWTPTKLNTDSDRF